MRPLSKHLKDRAIVEDFKQRAQDFLVYSRVMWSAQQLACTILWKVFFSLSKTMLSLLSLLSEQLKVDAGHMQPLFGNS